MKKKLSVLLLLSFMMTFVACEEISQLPLGMIKQENGISDEYFGNTEEETTVFTEYTAEIPEIITAEANMTIQAEECTLSGNLKIENKREGFKGEGYVTGFKGGKSDYLQIPVDIPTSQHYDITVRVAADSKVTNSIMINGNDIGEFIIDNDKEKFMRITFYGIYIEMGKAVIQLNKADGNFDFDYISIENNTDIYEEESIPEVKPVSEKSSYEVRDLLRYFKENYGENIITGQYASSDENAEVEYIYKLTGKYPVIRFGDIGGYGESKIPLSSEIEAALNWNERGGIVGFMWKWKTPAEDSSVYTRDTKFNLKSAVADKDVALFGISELQDLCRQGYISRECLAIAEDIDDVSEGFLELAEEGIPILWRPLYDAGNELYWWNAYGDDAYIWLYDFMFERMTKYHNLDNLIWIWDGCDENFLPNNDKYDIVSTNIYLRPNTTFGSRSDRYQWLRKITESGKFIALGECSGIPGISEMLRDKSMWSFFGLWYGKYLKRNQLSIDEVYTTEQELIRMYNAENSITLDEYAGIYGVGSSMNSLQ